MSVPDYITENAEQHAKQEAESVVGVPQINEQSAALVKSKRTDQAATVGPMLFSPASDR